MLGAGAVLLLLTQQVEAGDERAAAVVSVRALSNFPHEQEHNFYCWTWPSAVEMRAAANLTPSIIELNGPRYGEEHPEALRAFVAVKAKDSDTWVKPVKPESQNASVVFSLIFPPGYPGFALVQPQTRPVVKTWYTNEITKN